VSANGASAASGDFDVGGGLFGGTIGYSRQFGPWVFGGEADLDWVNIDGSKAFALAPAGIAINGSVLSRLEWLDTIRGRVGYTWGPTLVYLTGGAAYGAVTAQVPFSITAFGAGLTGFLGQTDTRLGWTIGVGLEQQILLPQLTGKLEYLYVDLGTNTQLIVDNVKFTTNILRVGGNWHF
jgi:outer membrane immunogenic protein